MGGQQKTQMFKAMAAPVIAGRTQSPAPMQTAGFNTTPIGTGTPQAAANAEAQRRVKKATQIMNQPGVIGVNDRLGFR
jgi:hypothetical protein